MSDRRQVLEFSWGPQRLYAASLTSRESGSTTNSQACINSPWNSDCLFLRSTNCDTFANARSNLSRSKATETGNVTRTGPVFFEMICLEAIPPPSYSEACGVMRSVTRSTHGNSAAHRQSVSKSACLIPGEMTESVQAL